MNSGIIRQDIDGFQVAVKRLSGEIGKASAIWNDPKFSELSSTVRLIADISKSVIITGEKSCVSIDKFVKLSEEEY